MEAQSRYYSDWVEAENDADLLAGDNPGLVVWLVEGWGDSARYDFGADADDLVLVWATTVEDAQDQVDRYAWAMWERQYDATKEPLPDPDPTTRTIAVLTSRYTVEDLHG